MYYPVQRKTEYHEFCGCGGECVECQEMSGILSSIGKGFKAVGKVGLKVAAGSGLPGISQAAGIVDGMIPQGGGSPDMEKKCSNAKNAKKKDCVAYNEQKAAAQAAQSAQQKRDDMQMQLLQQLADKQNAPASTGIGGIDPMYLMIGGGALVVVFLMSRS